MVSNSVEFEAGGAVAVATRAGAWQTRPHGRAHVKALAVVVVEDTALKLIHHIH